MSERLVRRGDGEALVASPTGDRIVLEIAGEHSHGTVAFAEYTSAPGQPGPPPHVHEAHEECFYVVRGELSMLVGTSVVVAGPRDFAFAPRGVTHTFWNAGDEPCVFVAAFTPAGFESVFREAHRLIEDGDIDALRELPSRFGTTVVPWPEGTRPRRR